MKSYSLSHLADRTLLQDLAVLVARDSATLASLLAHLAEVDARKLYLPAAHPSMYSYCVHELHLSEDSACKRIRAARAAREFPVLFAAVAEGRLNLSGVLLLAPHLKPKNVDELVAAATRRNNAEIEQLLAERFPSSELLTLAEAIPISPAMPGGQPAIERAGAGGDPVGPVASESSAARRTEACDLPAKLKPIAPQRFALQLAIGQRTHDKLKYAQDLLSHQVPSGDLAEVLERVLELAIPQLEKRKFAATQKPRQSAPRTSSNPRHIPAHVKRAVWKRDGGRCTFVSESGRRCPARTRLEFDHLDEVARRGQASVGGIRLRCQAHNQYGAERTFGVGFMRRRREGAQRAAAVAREKTDEVIPWLRALGFRADEARRAAGLSGRDGPLEQRVREALGHLAPRACSRSQAAAAPGAMQADASASMGARRTHRIEPQEGTPCLA